MRYIFTIDLPHDYEKVPKLTIYEVTDTITDEELEQLGITGRQCEIAMIEIKRKSLISK